MIKVLALSGLETAINSYLHLDSDTLKKLAALSDKVIEIQLTDWEGSFFIFPDEDGLQLLVKYDGAVTTTIKAKLFNLMRVVKAGANSRAVFDNTLLVSGDTEVAEKLRDILNHIDIDWEEHLSRLVGDSFAHRIAYGMQKALSFGRETV
ncbi:MAG: SCP2 sterol-binding domain-containing protein, partial [Gammaproteobacteria bacterium]|nr:SCP2 sterol-binding domain-containing protein [Gammaproteobacteria bacterium]